MNDRRRCVLYLVRTWAMGGSHTIIRSLLRHLPRERFRAVVAPFAAHTGVDERFADIVRAEGAEVADARIPWHSRSAWPTARDAVAKLIESYEADLVHTHDPNSTVLVGVGRRRWRCACVASSYGWWNRLLPLRSHIYFRLERDWALPNFDRVITVSDNMRARILRGPAQSEKVRVIRTGVDRVLLETGASREASRSALDIAPGAFVVGSVGRVYVEKGHRYLLDAAARLRDVIPELAVLIVGDGPLLPELAARARSLGIADRVRMPGYWEDLPGALRAMDVFALPSVLAEGFPTVLLEAQALALPVIATDVGGTRETMVSGRTGELVRSRRPAELAEAIARMYMDPERRVSMGRAGRSLVADRFRLETMVALTAAVYDEAVETYRARRG